MEPTGASLPSSPDWKRVRESIQTWNETLGAVDVDVGRLLSGNLSIYSRTPYLMGKSWKPSYLMGKSWNNHGFLEVSTDINKLLKMAHINS